MFGPFRRPDRAPESRLEALESRVTALSDALSHQVDLQHKERQEVAQAMLGVLQRVAVLESEKLERDRVLVEITTRWAALMKSVRGRILREAQLEERRNVETEEEPDPREDSEAPELFAVDLREVVRRR